MSICPRHGGSARGGHIFIGVSDKGAKKYLNELVEKNILDSREKGRNTHYVLKRVGD
jgi:hypothetical protein